MSEHTSPVTRMSRRMRAWLALGALLIATSVAAAPSYRYTYTSQVTNVYDEVRPGVDWPDNKQWEAVFQVTVDTASPLRPGSTIDDVTRLSFAVLPAAEGIETMVYPNPPCFCTRFVTGSLTIGALDEAGLPTSWAVFAERQYRPIGSAAYRVFSSDSFMEIHHQDWSGRSVLGFAFDPVGTWQLAVVPEPGTWILMVAGLLAIGRSAHRRYLKSIG